MDASAAAESEWVQLLDETSKSFYYANIVTHETSWDAPPSFIKHEDIQTSFEPVEQAAASVGQENPVADPQQLTSTSTSPEPNAAAASSSQVPDETPLSADNEPLRGSSISTPEQQVAEPSLIIPVEAQPSSNNDLSPVARTQVIPPLVPHPLAPEANSSAPVELLKKKKVTGYVAQQPEVATESHPLFEFASTHYNLVSSSSSSSSVTKKPLLSFAFKKPQKQLLDLRTRLYWESGLIAAPITKLPKAQAKVALQAFRNISGFMGNRSSGKGQIDHCFKLLRNVAPKSHDLKDEIYCQLCKQLTGNPDVNAVLNGWLLLNACLITFPPSKELAPYLERFFAQHVGAMEPELAQYATDGLHSLQSSYIKGERKELPCPMEIQALRDHSMIEIAVSLLDDTPIKASVSAWTTCTELLKMVSSKLGIRKTDAFALFETSNFHEERVIEGDERVLDLYALWERIGTEREPKKKKKSSKKQSDERSYRLVYKVYLWIDIDDELVEEVSMLYLQAVHNITRGIYACSLEKCIELAGYQLYCRRGEHQPSSEQHVDLLTDIEQYVPRNVLRPANRERICEQVMAAYAALDDNTSSIANSSMRSGGTSLRQCKLAYLRICKTLRFYGATFFAAQNTRNPKMPSEVVLAVSYKGLSIVSVENEAALADFLYVDVASWGYSANSFVFVVARAGGEETEHVLKTTAGKHINDIITAYVKYIVTLTPP